MWQTYALGSAFFAALTAILTKVGVKDVPSNLATAIRTVVVLLLAWGLVFARGESGALRTLPRQSVLFLIISGVATGLSWLCYFRALQLGPASQVAPLDKLSLPLTIILAAIFLGEKFSMQTLAGILLIGAGTYVLTR
jgi:transporter family protein